MKKDDRFFNMGDMIVLSIAYFDDNLFKDKTKNVFTKKEIKKQLKETARALNDQFIQLGLDFDEPIKFKKPMPSEPRD